MLEFFDAVFTNPHASFLRNALIAGVLAGISFSVVGTYVVARRIGSIAGAIAHCVLGGIGAAIYLNRIYGWQWLDPLYGAFVAGVVAALVIGLVSIYAKEREDTIIAAIWSTGMAIGFLFVAKTPGSGVDLMRFLEGNILLVSREAIVWVIVLGAVVIVSSILFYPKFVAICFDAEFAQLRGVQSNLLYLFLLILTAISIVLLASVIGILMVIALFVIPPALASGFTRQLWQVMIGSVIICTLLIVFGMAISYGQDLPSGPTIVVLAGILYFVGTFAGIAARKLIGRPRADASP